MFGANHAAPPARTSHGSAEPRSRMNPQRHRRFRVGRSAGRAISRPPRGVAIGARHVGNRKRKLATCYHKTHRDIGSSAWAPTVRRPDVSADPMESYGVNHAGSQRVVASRNTAVVPRKQVSGQFVVDSSQLVTPLGAGWGWPARRVVRRRGHAQHAPRPHIGRDTLAVVVCPVDAPTEPSARKRGRGCRRPKWRRRSWVASRPASLGSNRHVVAADRKSVVVGKECRSRWSPYH